MVGQGARTLIVVAIAVVAMVDGLGPRNAARAEGSTRLFRIRAVTTSTTADGIVLDRVNGGPVITLDGQQVGTAYVTSFREHPGLALPPTHIEIQSGSGTAIIGGLRSQDWTFSQTLGYDNFLGGMTFASANFLKADDEFLVSYDRLPAGSPASETYSHAFDFTQNRVDRQIGDTGLAFRPGNQWFLVTAFGQKTLVGDNPSYSFTSLTAPAFRFGNVNMLRLPEGESGAVITCYGNPGICGFKGIGDYAGLYGTAISRAPGSLGVTGSAASDTTVTYRLPPGPPDPPGCPPGTTPAAPTNLVGGRKGGSGRLAWNSVKCAKFYVVRLIHADGRTEDISAGPLTTIGYSVSNYFDVVAFSVAARSASGVQGPFSEQASIGTVTS